MSTAERFVTQDEFHEMREELADLTRRVGDVEQRLGVVEERLDKVEQRLDKVECRLDELVARFDAFEQYVEAQFDAQRRLIDERHAELMKAVSDGNTAVLSAVMQLLRRAE